MTAIDTTIRQVQAPAARTDQQVDTASAPERLRSVSPLVPRTFFGSIFDALAVGFTRAFDRTRIAHRMHDAVLRKLDYSDVPLEVSSKHTGLAGLRIAFLTDLHVGSYLGESRLMQIFEDVAKLEPDLVCYGGDMINSRTHELGLLSKPLKLLNPKLGSFAVAGNHDHRWHADMGEWHDFMESHGVTVFNNHGTRIQRRGSSLWLAGVDDLTDGRPDMDRALQGRQPGEPTILLAHQPDHFVEAAQHGVDLVLSGHTHGGQLRMFGWAPVTHSKHGYRAGDFRIDNSRLYVSRGVGVTILPMRMGATPEIPIVRLQSSD